MDPFEYKMNKAFQKLATDIKPDEDYLKKAKVCADKVIKLLQGNSKFNIGRVCIGGSSGKKTTIMNSDVDCVLFINGELPPFEHVLDDFENILTTSGSYNIREIEINSKYSIQFKALEFEFDLLPAVNFTEGHQVDGDELIDIQQREVLRRIKQDPKNNRYMYSSSLADATVRFMKQQSGFVHEMVRIAKFWYKTLYFSDFRRKAGAKLCIELIAVYAAKQEERMGTISYLRAFKRFIDYLINFDGLNIVFESNQHEVWDSSRPRVMDPVNPYNNLTKNWDSKSIQLLTQYANESNRRLQISANLRIVRLDQLFEQQPVYRVDMREIFGDARKSHWLVGTVTYSSLPDLKVRNESFHTDDGLSKRLDIFKNYLQFAVYASRASDCEESQVKETVKNTISKQIYNGEMTWNSAVVEKHEDYDVTFTVPFSNQKAIRISYRL